MKTLRQVLRVLFDATPIRSFREARYRRAFAEGRNGWPRFYGLFGSRGEAETQSPSTRLTGYDHSEVVDVSADVMATVWTSDYPVIYWIHRFLESSETLFDLGGHTGTKYRAWREYLPLRDSFIWLVCDLPALVEAGRRLPGEHPHLDFTTCYHRASGADILLASGSLQYLDRDLEEILSNCERPPTHLILNKVPTHEREDVYTLENLRRSTVPYRIFNRERLVSNLEALGYRQRDRWIVAESCVRVPFTTLGEPVHLGFYFLRDEGA